MAQLCANCGVANEPDVTSCFTCGHTLIQSIRQGQLVDSRYEIRERLGRGGMGAVYRAWDRTLEEEVALKVLREGMSGTAEASRRFRTEIKLARKVIHRNVCRIFEYGEDAGLTYISMELIEGTDLKQLVDRAGHLPLSQAFSIAIQVADGLEAIHHVGVIHRDLKASNIMIDGSGAVRLMDFGIAKEAAHDATGATATGHVIGTPSCMSPEQARGERVDFRSDIYSLGVVIFELFAGQPLFDGDTPVALLMKHIHEPPPLHGPRAARLPPSLIPVLAKALAKTREERFGSAGELSRALRHAMSAATRGDTTAPGGATLDVSPFSDDPRERPTVVQPRTVVPASDTGRGAETGFAPTVAMTSASRTAAHGAAPRVSRRVALGAGLALVAIALVFLVARDREQVVAPTPAGVVASGAPAAAPVEVRFNALPWARLKLTAREPEPGGAQLPADGLVTPCALALPAGRYTVELENGGLTSPLVKEIEVGAGQPRDFVFTMPAFDPARAAEAALDRSS
jgi:predicted Ser/Thr protein kinase